MAGVSVMVEKQVTKEQVTVTKRKEEKEQKVGELTDLPGIGDSTADKLREAGYHSILAVAAATPSELSEAGGLGETVARKVISAARSALDMGFQSGDELLEKRKLIRKLSSGSLSLNTLLGGGFESGAITEAFGEYGSGKTQMGLILAVNNFVADPESYTIFIDTENTFRPERIVQLAKGVGADPDLVLKRIKVARAFNSDHQVLLAERVEDLIANDGLKVSLVVVDSLTAHFRAEFIGRGTLAERQQKLNRHMHTLMKLASMHNLCVYVTNQVMVRPDVFFGDPTEAIGGHIVAHASTFRMYFRRGKKGSRVAKLVDSPNLPEGEACFFVTEAGLKDV